MGKVIQIGGTHGSGKSTLMRRLLGANHNSFKSPAEGFKYTLPNVEHPTFAVAGHYKSACGGCDGISTVDELCDTIHWLSQQFPVVMYEGALLYVKRNLPRLELVYGIRPDIYLLNLSADECIDSVLERRFEAGNDKPLDPKALLAKHKGYKTYATFAVEEGYSVTWGNREELYNTITQQLHIS